MTGALFHLGRFCVRRRWLVLGTWLLVFVVLAVWARALGPNASDNLTLPGTDSHAATDLLEQRFPSQANGTNPVMLRAPQGEKISAGKYKQPIDDTVSALKADPAIRSVKSPLSSDESGLLSKDQKIGYIALNLRPSSSDLSLDTANRIVALADPARGAGLEVGFGGYLGQKVSKPETHSSEVIGLAMAVIVLVFTFGTVVAMGLPILTAIIGLVCGLAMITLISHITDVPTVAPTLATMIGLGVGIDYALFIVTRHLDQRRDGMETRESIARAAASSGGAVVFAGSTVIVALLSLAVVNIPLVTTLGYTAALVVAVAVLAAITLLPAILGLVGDRIDKLPVPLAPRQGRCPAARLDALGRLRRAAHPLPCALVAIVVLVALALPTLDLYLGQQDNGAMPESTDVRRASDGLTAGFGAGHQRPAPDQRRPVQAAGQGGPGQPRQALQAGAGPEGQGEPAGEPAGAADRRQLEAGPAARAGAAQAQAQVQPQLDKQINKIEQQSETQRKKLEQLATDPRLQDLKKDIAKTAGVKKVTEPLVNSDGTAAVLNATPTTDPSDRATADLVDRLRDTAVPKAEKGNDMTVNVGGQTANYVDLASEIASRLIITIAVVVGLSFILLMLAFRSIVIPLTAGLMNLVSIGAAFGVVTAVFEKGWGASLVGLDGEVPIVSFVPLMMFAILFGLSMDYEVFLMTHIREAWQHTRNNRQAVIEGIGTTGPRDHLGRADHGQRVLRLHHQRRPDGQAVRRRHGRRRGRRRDARALPARARRDGAARALELVVPALARQAPAQPLDRGRGMVPRARPRGAPPPPKPNSPRRCSRNRRLLSTLWSSTTY